MGARLILRTGSLEVQLKILRTRVMKYLVYTSAKPPGVLQKTVAAIATVGLIGLGLMFSAVLLPFILAIIAAVWGYLWWKTRELRRQMKQMQDFAAQNANVEREIFRGETFREEVFEGEVIEGEATRVNDPSNSRRS